MSLLSARRSNSCSSGNCRRIRVGRASRWNCFQSWLNKLKNGRYHMCQWGANSNPWAAYRMGLSPTPRPPNPQTGGRKDSLSNCIQLVIDRQKECQISKLENTYSLPGCEVCHEQSYSLRQSPKWVNADRVQYVRSSSGLITIVVITLFFLSLIC